MSDKKTAIICGSRSIDDPQAIADAIERTGWELIRVIHGAAPGVDTLAEQWADTEGVVVETFPIHEYAQGDHDETAGPRRNAAMLRQLRRAQHPACIAIWDGESSGTMDMVRRCRRHGIPTSVYRPALEERQEGLF